MSYCEDCGTLVKPGDEFCENCGTHIAHGSGESQTLFTQGAPLPATTVLQQEVEGPVGGKNAALAAIASFLFSGLGQVYNGRFGKGLLIFVGTLIGLLFFIIPGILILCYGIYDAYSTAKKMNEGRIPFVPHQNSHIIAFIIIGVVILSLYIAAIAGIGELLRF